MMVQESQENMPNTFIREDYISLTMCDDKIIELIKRRRFQMLIHSYLYYKLDQNIITDYKWSEWATELAQLQKDYPTESKKAPFYIDFKRWDGSSGAFLPLDRYDWIQQRAEYLAKRFT